MTKEEKLLWKKFADEKYRNKLPFLNAGNNTGIYEAQILQYLVGKFKEKLTILVVGSAYGGEVEFIAKLLYGRCNVYGYDTFIGHPKDLADDPTSLEATCMQVWYDAFGMKGIEYDYQRKLLDEQELFNAHLIKGRVNEHSFDDIKKAHFVMLDMDLIKPTRVAYHAIKDKIVKGGFLFFHDALPIDHLPLIHQFVYDEVLKDKRWNIVKEDNEANLTVLRRNNV